MIKEDFEKIRKKVQEGLSTAEEKVKSANNFVELNDALDEVRDICDCINKLQNIVEFAIDGEWDEFRDMLEDC